MNLNENQFTAGFNAGYLLAEYEPKMLTVLLKEIQPENSYITGMSSGQKEYELEQLKSNLNELEQLRHQGRKERDIDH